MQNRKNSLKLISLSLVACYAQTCFALESSPVFSLQSSLGYLKTEATSDAHDLGVRQLQGALFNNGILTGVLIPDMHLFQIINIEAQVLYMAGSAEAVQKNRYSETQLNLDILYRSGFRVFRSSEDMPGGLPLDVFFCLGFGRNIFRQAVGSTANGKSYNNDHYFSFQAGGGLVYGFTSKLGLEFSYRTISLKHDVISLGLNYSVN